MTEQGRKFDGGKLRYDLVPVLAFEDQVKGLTYGATKYDDNNWRNVPEGRKRYMAAAMRHLQEYRKGNVWDDEQGIHHLSAAINNFSFIVEKDLQGWEDVPEVFFKTEEDFFGHGKVIAKELDKQDVSQEQLKTPTGKVLRMPLHYKNSVDRGDIDVLQHYKEECEKRGVKLVFEGDESLITKAVWYPENDGSWVEWTVGCPPLSVSGDTFVKLLLSYERSTHNTACQVYRVEDADWENHGNSLDIVAYKTIPSCECCGGCGTIDETLGGYAFSNPKATCPDCQGNGYVEIKEKD